MSGPILLGWDASPAAHDALALARLLAAARRAPLEVVCAYHPEAITGPRAARPYAAALRDEAETRLTQARTALAGEPDVTFHLVAARSTVAALTRAAADGAEALVVGSSHRGRVGRVLAGSVAEGLLDGSPVPVAVAPTGFRWREGAGLRTIAVAFDGRSGAHAALEFAVDLAERGDARLLHLITVLGPAERSRPAYGAAYGVAELEHDARAELRGRLDDALAAVRTRVPAEGELLEAETEGDAAAVLATAAEDADLLVGGSRGYGSVRAVLLGSMSRRLVRHAPAPVLVVPRGAKATGDEAAAAPALAEER